MKIKKINVAYLVWVLIVLLVLAIGYIAYDKYSEVKEAERMDYYASGAQYGYTSAIVEIMNKAAQCEQVPLYADNQTLNLVAIECLQQDEG